ncbi:hypothetical protein FKW77_008219 [Venturia effusa]|uniref:Secreted protein n=1 Tax=Venturia effusa TaxID=50376 RepID=A0A517LKM7_9PEZI|nr:hypothetical protein FKW77_008219 [Venturia effusa]
MRSIITTTAAAIIILLCFYFSNSSIATSVGNMTGFSPTEEAPDPHPTNSSLQLTLAVKEPSTSPPTLLVTATNLHGSTSITLLKWDTPFDDKALLLGIFNIKDLNSGATLPNLNMKINRVTPPPRDAFLEIEPRSAITKELVLSELPGAKLEKDTEYEIQAKGKWKAVWHASVKDIDNEQLKKMGGGTGVMTWDFESNSARFKA